MIVLLSPSKTMDFEKDITHKSTQARFLDKTDKLINKLSKLSKPKLKKLMSISDNLAQLNYDRYRSFENEHTSDNSKQAIYAFTGDVFTGFKVDMLDDKDIEYAQNHIRILSGLYGVLRPLDLIQPYRLEMGTKLKIYRNDNLYEFWDSDITNIINKDIQSTESEYVINVASNEYFNAIHSDKIEVPIIEIDFREWRGDELKFISFNAKKARGMMARYIVQRRCSSLNQIKQFDLDGYSYDKERSEEHKILFTKSAE